MDNLRRWFTIKQLVTGGPIILLVILSLVLGISRYNTEYEVALNHALELAKTGAQSILGLMKKSVGGGNYANVLDEDALELYEANGELLFFSVEGKTDGSGEPYGIAYLRERGEAVRSFYPADYRSGLEARLTKIRKALERLSGSPVPLHSRWRMVITWTSGTGSFICCSPLVTREEARCGW